MTVCIVDIDDAKLVRQILIGCVESVPAADVNKDEYINICDLGMLDANLNNIVL